ncbi:MAG: UDP-3-O-(3-hydroxymyristoyl)glucosamine N-acyltransferase [Acidobacteriota bacterium]
MSRRLADIAAAVSGRLEGDPERRITGVAALDVAGAAEISFLANPRYRRAARASSAGALLVGIDEKLGDRDVVRVADPYLAWAHTVALFAAPPAPARGVSPQAVVGEDTWIGATPDIGPAVVIGAGCRLGDRIRVHPGVVIGEGVVIGDDVILYPQVTLYAGVRLGDRVILHAGVVVGSDGFGYALDGATPVKVPQIGSVLIEDDVEIGAGVCIDRGALGDTRIGRGTRIDNLVQVAHNVQLGENCLLAAQAGISGSTRLGRSVMMAGQSGIVGHVRLGDGVRVAAKSAVTKDVKAGVTVAGVPAVEISRWRRATAAVSRLPRLLARVSRLEKEERESE